MAAVIVPDEDKQPFDDFLRSQNRSVSFIAGSELVNIDLCNEPSSKELRDKEFGKEELLLAGILIEEATLGRNGYFKTSYKELTYYKTYNKTFFRVMVYFCIWMNLSLALFEEPAVPGLKMPYWATMLLEYFCLFVFVLRLFHVWLFAAGVKFWKDKKNVIMLVVIVLTFVDMIMYIIFREVEMPSHTRRWTRIFRPLFLINISEGRQIRRAFRNIRKTLPEIANVLVLLLLGIGLFTLLGVKLFGKRNLKDAQGKPYFVNYWDTYFDMYVLTTTANNPDIMMPAYDNEPWSSLFFVVFIITCMYIFVSIFLAVVYKNYRTHLKNEVRKSVYRKRRQLKQAFDVAKVWLNDAWVVTEDRWQDLVKEVRPRWSEARRALLWQVLDHNGDGCIVRKDFMMMADLLNVEVLEVKDQIHFLERFAPKLYMSRVSARLRWVVCHKYFAYFFDVVIFANAIFIALEKNDVEVLFLVIFNIEIALKLYTYGLKEFFQVFWNVFDFLIIGAATLALIIEASYESLQSSQGVLDLLMVLRVLRLVKIMGTIERFKVIIGTVLQIGPACTTYGAIMFILYYMFAILGMELFSGTLDMRGYPSVARTPNSTVETWNETTAYCGNIKLKGSDFYGDRYCNNNFNSVLRAFKVLFDLTVVNQWHVITQGFVLVTNTWARLYFFTFHLLCVIVVLNIFVAFILEAFMLEYSFTHGKIVTAVSQIIEEKGVGVGMSPIRERAVSLLALEDEEEVQTTSREKYESDPRLYTSVEHLALDRGLRFRIPEQQSKNAETLLQEMFENELDDDDVGPKETEDIDDVSDNEIEEYQSRRKMTFETVDAQ